MRLVNFNKGVKEIKNDNNETLYFPYMVIDGKEAFYSEQGKVVFYDNLLEAEEYNQD